MPIIGQWAFDDSDGDGADTSGNANTAAFNNGAAQNSSGQAMLDGVNDYIEIADSSQYALTSGTIHGVFTAAPGSLGGSQSTSVGDPDLQALFSRDSNGYDDGGHLSVFLDADGSIFIRHQSDSQNFTIRTDPGVVTEGEPFDLVYEFSDTGGMVLYVDGVEVGCNTDVVGSGDSIALSGNSEPWTLGASQITSGDAVANNLQQFFEGDVCHFEIYDEPLSPAELDVIHDLSDGVDDGLIAGTGGNDTIYGGAGIEEADGGQVIDDTINAGGGDDTVYAGDGGDLVHGGDGTDVLDGGDGINTLYGDAGDDTLVGGQNDDYLAGGADDDLLYGNDGANTLDGGDGNDIVIGGADDDILIGGAGNDILFGKEGNDTITTGAGNDTVILQHLGAQDLVTDFDIADSDNNGTSNDRLDISELRNLDGDPVNLWDITVTDDGSGNAVLTFPEGESLTLQGISPAQMTPQQMIASGIPCFTAGTMILTPNGERPIESLKTGDRVETRDHGAQPIRWLASRTVSEKQLTAQPNLRPVRLGRSWTGTGRDLVVSPQHGIVITPPSEGKEVLARAAQLARLKGGKVRVAAGVRNVTYFHMLLPRHAIVFSNGLATESFFPGLRAVETLAPQVLLSLLAELQSLDPTSADFHYGAPVLPYARTRDLGESLDGLRGNRAFGANGRVAVTV